MTTKAIHRIAPEASLAGSHATPASDPPHPVPAPRAAASSGQRCARALTGLVVVAIGLAACAAPQQQAQRDGQARPDAADEVIEFEPTLIRVTPSAGDSPRVVTLQVRGLFDEGNAYLAAGDYPRAIDRYQLILDTFDDPQWRRMTLYNLGLVHEELGDHETAASHYVQVIDGWPTSRDAADALFRLAECYVQLEAAHLVPPLLRRVLNRSDIRHLDRVEAHLRMGMAYLEQRRFAEAEDAFRAVVSINDAQRLAEGSDGAARGDRADRALPGHHIMVAQAQYSLGRIYHELFSEIRMLLPLERYRRDLRDKQQLFEQAREAYLATVYSGNAYWAPAAGMMIGRLYEDFYLDVLASEVPEDFGALEHEIYFEELRAFIAPGLDRALNMYEHALAMGYRMNTDQRWLDETLAGIHRVRDYLAAPERWDEEHELIVRNQHPRSGRRTEGLVFRDEVD